MAKVSAEMFRGYPLLTRQIEIAGRAYELLGPANFESLIDNPRVAERFATDEYMPYWAEFWPAAVLLAEEVATWDDVTELESPPRVLELGCGLGLIGLVAAARGYDVILSDYDDDALAFVRESAIRSGLPPVDARQVDWRNEYPDLLVDRIVAAEVLYEPRNISPIVSFISRHLRPGGFALICDAQRRPADAFADAAGQAGLSVEIKAMQRERAAPEKPLQARMFRVTRQ